MFQNFFSKKAPAKDTTGSKLSGLIDKIAKAQSVDDLIPVYEEIWEGLDTKDFMLYYELFQTTGIQELFLRVKALEKRAALLEDARGA